VGPGVATAGHHRTYVYLVAAREQDPRRALLHRPRNRRNLRKRVSRTPAESNSATNRAEATDVQELILFKSLFGSFVTLRHLGIAVAVGVSRHQFKKVENPLFMAARRRLSSRAEREASEKASDWIAQVMHWSASGRVPASARDGGAPAHAHRRALVQNIASPAPCPALAR
jgi:hypothetical protein